MRFLYFFSIVFLFVSTVVFAQQAPPQGINYQAVVYAPTGNQQPGVNSAGQQPANMKQVAITFTLEEGYNGPIIYQETHLDTTDQYGLVNTVIGMGTTTSISPGLFSNIDWSLGDPYLRVSITLTQYNTTVNSYQKLWSVPYALYAGQSNSATYADTSAYADSSGYAELAGNGITGVTDNGNGTMTFNYLNGSSYTTPVLTGLIGPAGPAGQNGTNGTNGQSAYELWLAQGNTGTQQQFLSSLQGTNGNQGPAGLNGINGQSAYELWLSQGNTGTQQQFLSSLQGANGAQGPAGPVGIAGLAGLDGTNGQSAYEIWLAQGNTGTQQQFLTSLQGATGTSFFSNMQVFASAGNFTFTVPSGVTKLMVEVWGGGGGGGNGSTTSSGFLSGGGGGGYGKQVITVVSGNVYSLVVGSGGTGGGGNGGNSSFGNLISATGGVGGMSVGTYQIPVGGSSSAIFNVTGGEGQWAGSTNLGANGGLSYGGPGGRGALNGLVSVAGSAPGGGGGSGCAAAGYTGGSPGGAGRVVVWY
jgi:hypothetical protein